MKTIAQQIKWDFKTNGILEVKGKNGKRIYWETSDGFWGKSELDSRGKEIYWENSYGSWVKKEYDSQGNIIYYENSSHGVIEDKRPKSCEVEEIIIDGVKYKLVKQ